MKMLNAKLMAALAGTAVLTLGSQAAPLQIDMSTGMDGSAPIGWVSISGTGSPSGTFSGYTELASGDITVSLSNISFDRLYRNGFTGSLEDFPGTDLDAMYGDLLFRNNDSATINISIAGLQAGSYTITTHHLHAGPGVTPTEFDLIRTDATGTLTIGNFAMGTGKADAETKFFDPTIVSFDVVSNGTNPITLVLDATAIGTGGNTGGWYGVNGLEIALVPEPSSLALLGLGGLMVVRRRRG